MAEANPDPSGSTGEFRAFVERGQTERRQRLRSPVVAMAAALAAAIVVVVVLLVIR